ncbi:SDR family oxidoreductase [Corynebacterium aurimucosum]|uniref:SDR family oxidoreductase n=1 Tax=Corynebacterium guaraldiae TaxID=3051103 RepID=A0ABY3CV52_9CORY|nr:MULTISPECIES: SDR family oxidoreductase [Corynebacterium]MBE7364808.1 SDR family oxidoreductase [Corynebacterium aurimucosum]TRX49753.1 SDR family oxidoreductase [Corynebacterium guaraldiae]TRX51447.1 SDR family oxidoreductase [Corynebacterium guaraldiae]
MGALLILGGRSDIGGELARRLCAGRPVVLAARGEHGMDELTSELLRNGATSVHTLSFDAADVSSHRAVIEQAATLAGEDITTAVVAFGILGDQEQAEHDEAHAFDIALVDYAAQVSMLTVLADVMKSGHIVAFSSIAGWRARRANYVYGSTKAGLDAFCQGLADRLQGSGLALITARPGFVIGSMTQGMKPAPLSVTPDVVAQAVVKAVESSPGSRPVSRTLWIPRTLQLLAWVMKLVPRPIWRHMPR